MIEKPFIWRYSSDWRPVQGGRHLRDDINEVPIVDIKYLYFDWNVPGICSNGPKQQYVDIGSGEATSYYLNQRWLISSTPITRGLLC